VRVRVKICGVTRQQDALAAVAAGADAIGLNFHPPSARFVSVERAVSIAAVVPPFVSLVGLFVDAPAAAVAATLSRVPLALLQFQGDEPSAFCATFQRPYLKAVRVRQPVDIATLRAQHPGAAGFLLDTYAPGQAGGTGHSFDWSFWPAARDSTPLVLAGGLTPANVASAIRTLRPYAVDVCSGVEERPGVKDKALIERFIEEVASADDSRQ
jgi:phosphoribosylanthranilate isomerase